MWRGTIREQISEGKENRVSVNHQTRKRESRANQGEGCKQTLVSRAWIAQWAN